MKALITWLLNLLGLMSRARHEAEMQRMHERFCIQETAWELAVEMMREKDKRDHARITELEVAKGEMERAHYELRKLRREIREAEEMKFDIITAAELLDDSMDLSVEELFDISGAETIDLPKEQPQSGTRSERCHVAA